MDSNGHCHPVSRRSPRARSPFRLEGLKGLMNWFFTQRDGILYDDQNMLRGRGYAGRDAGKNNPEMENVKGIGPLPHGTYTGTQLFEKHPTVGAYAILLTPDAETRARILTYGRNPDSFFMHGDSQEHPGLASHGCIVQQRPIREAFWASVRKVDVRP